ncbi:conjugative transposon protein TraJ [Pontibacter sp. Tf4]|uniref:conjugative transposon protein TraJ n=1 Tax=Pontibacter sp. Tf4 TaxID=2761620 RepID=UPI001624B15D|nr:conjugative transposon protein TraJ [Pontibacter sp. Tf4]MBB6611815.1 conjugative transposon protein TraJ [Pontibacter sp. Tf4]
MKKALIPFLATAAILLLPRLAQAQGGTTQTENLHTILQQLYDQMLPLCTQLIGVGRALGGFAALTYIASRVWQHIAQAEPVDFYPLLRPFALGMAILLYPAVLALLNGVLQPTVTATTAMAGNTNQAVAVLLQQKEAAIQQSDNWQMYVGPDGNGDREKWYEYTHPGAVAGEGEGLLESIGNDVKFAVARASYNFRLSIKQWMAEVLELLFLAASLCIDTVRTFYLVILSVLGPLVLAFSILDGFRHTLTVWLARYINVFLWLPIANIFGSIIGKVQEGMLRLDISQVESHGNTFFSSTDTAYLIFLLMGIVGYFTVPSVAGYIVHAGGGNALLYKITNLFSAATHTSLTALRAGSTIPVTVAGTLLRRSPGEGEHPPTSTGSTFQHDRLSGNS